MKKIQRVHNWVIWRGEEKNVESSDGVQKCKDVKIEEK
jgi:hypothetical protein